MTTLYDTQTVSLGMHVSASRLVGSIVTQSFAIPVSHSMGIRKLMIPNDLVSLPQEKISNVFLEDGGPPCKHGGPPCKHVFLEFAQSIHCLGG